MNILELKNETLAAVYAVPEAQEKLFISANNKAVMIDINNIPIQNRTTHGVRIIDTRGFSTKIEIM